jgi:dipeptidase E
MEPSNPLLDEFVLDLAGRRKPRVCFLPTASGDADHYVVRFYRAFSADRCQPSHVSLFRRETGVGDLREHLLKQDLIYVGGGSVVSLLGVWRAHGVDVILREAWERGTVLCGLSAGSLCWFAEGLSEFHGPAVPIEGLGLLPYSNAVHYSDEPGRRERYQEHVRTGMRAGYAAPDGVALHFVGEELEQVVSSRPERDACYVSASGSDVIETRLPATYLGDAKAAEPAERAPAAPVQARRSASRDAAPLPDPAVAAVAPAPVA